MVRAWVIALCLAIGTSAVANVLGEQDGRMPGPHGAGSATEGIGIVTYDIEAGWATGFLVSPCHVLTVQHAARDMLARGGAKGVSGLFFYVGEGAEHGFARRIPLTPLRPDERRHYSHVGVKANDDAQLLRLQRCLGDVTPLRLEPMKLAAARRVRPDFVLYGFPGFVWDPETHTRLVEVPYRRGLWRESCAVRTDYEDDGDWLTHCSVTAGNSGSPLTRPCPGAGGVLCVVGIAVGTRIDLGVNPETTPTPETASFFVPVARVQARLRREIAEDLPRDRPGGLPEGLPGGLPGGLNELGRDPSPPRR